MEYLIFVVLLLYRNNRKKENIWIFQTKVELPTGSPLYQSFRTDSSDGLLFLLKNIGSLLAENKFRVDMNPFGILYNPLSVSAALVGGDIEGKVYQEKDLFLYKECWHSPMHHGSFSASNTQLNAK